MHRSLPDKFYWVLTSLINVVCFSFEGELFLSMTEQLHSSYTMSSLTHHNKLQYVLTIQTLSVTKT